MKSDAGKGGKEILRLVCRWTRCGEVFEDVDLLASHAAGHVATEEQICQWDECDEEFEDKTHLERHLTFHAFHEKLTAIGLTVIERDSLPSCRKARCIPDWDCEKPSVCLWNHCDAKFYDITTFYAHVQWHAMLNPRGKSPGVVIKCYWKGCNLEFKTACKLREHTRTHSEEKVVACPGCHLAFAGRVKLEDHLKRQDKKESQFKCSHCHKTFPTERILKDHLRRHINYYRCDLCHMTLASPAAIANHHRYRHQVDRPFKCPKEDCLYAAKREHDFLRHVATHNPIKSFKCPIEGCGSVFRTKERASYHLRHIHENGDRKKYVCHLCGGKWTRGSHLTKHLVKQHQILVPSCYNRYSYSRGEDGFYRMQLVRFEAVDVDGGEPHQVSILKGDEQGETLEDDENVIEVDVNDDDDDDDEVKEEEQEEGEGGMSVVEDERMEPETVASSESLNETEDGNPCCLENDDGEEVEAYVEDGEVKILHSRPLRPGDEVSIELLGGTAPNRARIRILTMDEA